MIFYEFNYFLTLNLNLSLKAGIFFDGDYVYDCIKRTYQPSVVKRQRTHGFLVRNSTKSGKNVLKRRKKKGRHHLSV